MIEVIPVKETVKVSAEELAQRREDPKKNS